jgi:quercetin dioxygenase-like cupin family protein/ribosomal protein S18 acetylase RimI-like enzyme
MAVMAAFVIAAEPVDSDDVQWCFEQYYLELGRLFGFVVSEALPLGLDELTPPRGLVLIAREAGTAVGCGALKLHEPGIGEIKRMWVAPTARGRGLGGRLLEALEAEARKSGKSHTRLETNRTLTAAVAMYRAHGYREVDPFNDEPFGDHWFEKDLAATDPALRWQRPPTYGAEGSQAMSDCTIIDLREPVDTPADGIVSRAIYNGDDVRVVHFSFAAGQQLSDHTAAMPVTLEIIEGEADITLDGTDVEGWPGTWIHMPANTPHSIIAKTPVTMLLTLLKRGA